MLDPIYNKNYLLNIIIYFLILLVCIPLCISFSVCMKGIILVCISFNICMKEIKNKKKMKKKLIVNF